MKKIIFLPLIAFLLTLYSCDKVYKVEMYYWIDSSSGSAKLPEDAVIKAKNDSIAYYTAYRKFMSSMAAKYISRKKAFDPENYYFKLISPTGEDLSAELILTDPSKVAALYFNDTENLFMPFIEYIESLPSENLFIWVSKGYVNNSNPRIIK